jgi:hypothetical protein
VPSPYGTSNPSLKITSVSVSHIVAAPVERLIHLCPDLTRQRDVARWIADGKSNDSIASARHPRRNREEPPVRRLRQARRRRPPCRRAGGAFEMRRVNAASALPSSA